MPEPMTGTAIVPAPTVGQELQLVVSEFTALGAKATYSMAIPDNITAREASVKLRTFLLKQNQMKDASLAQVLHAVLYADNMGLDIMAGDVYIVAGRIATTA